MVLIISKEGCIKSHKAIKHEDFSALILKNSAKFQLKIKSLEINFLIMPIPGFITSISQL